MFWLQFSILSRTNYCNAWYVGLPFIFVVHKVQKVENTPARPLLIGNNDKSWFPVWFQVHIIVLVPIFTALNSLQTKYLWDDLHPYVLSISDLAGCNLGEGFLRGSTFLGKVARWFLWCPLTARQNNFHCFSISRVSLISGVGICISCQMFCVLYYIQYITSLLHFSGRLFWRARNMCL